MLNISGDIKREFERNRYKYSICFEEIRNDRIRVGEQHSSLDQRRRTEMFVIMLDDLLEVYPQHWPISGQNSDIEALRTQQQYSSTPEVIPRSHAQMILRENKSLINVQTGKLDHGAIYEQKTEKESAV